MVNIINYGLPKQIIILNSIFSKVDIIRLDNN